MSVLPCTADCGPVLVQAASSKEYSISSSPLDCCGHAHCDCGMQILGSTLAGATGSTISACSYCAQYVGGAGSMLKGYASPNNYAASWEACAFWLKP